MATAKEIIVKPISSTDASMIVKRIHYSGKIVNNSTLHFGVFLNGKIEGVMSFGNSLDKRKIQGLVKNTDWNSFIELNRMAFSDKLPRNSESRALSVAFRLIKKNYPHIEWIVSFADGTQCGDGTIYRASGFVLTGFSEGSMWLMPEELAKYNEGSRIAHRMKVQDKRSHLSRFIIGATNGKNLTMKGCAQKFGGEVMKGFMFRYIYFLNPTAKSRLTVPIIPFSKIDEMDAGMYKGIKRVSSADNGTCGDQSQGGRCDSDRYAPKFRGTAWTMK